MQGLSGGARAAWALVGLAMAAAGGCREGAGTGAEAGASASAEAGVGAGAHATASAEAGAEAGSGAAVSGAPDGAVALCRIMASEGGPSASADATGWLDVAAKANFTVRTLESGRELRFEGPGRVRACGGDVALVAEGSAVGLPGSGEAPGAEQWVATACGVARWASGVHRLVGARDTCILQSSMGSASLYLAVDVTAEEVVDGGAPEAGVPSPAAGGAGPWRRIDAKRAFRLRGRGSLATPVAVKAALGACEGAAQNVQSLAARMTSPEAGTGSVGELAAESVVARGVARAACAVAAVRLALSGSRPEDQGRLDAASARWRAPDRR